MFLINPHLLLPKFLLDQFPGAAGAYSVRKLREGATKAIRVRETGGGTEADIGFDSQGNLDETALLNHVGSNNGYVVKWYDQGGNGNDAAQSTASNQPLIVNSGSVVKKNDNPALDFDGIDDILEGSAITATSPELFAVITSKGLADGEIRNGGIVTAGESGNNLHFGGDSSQGTRDWYDDFYSDSRPQLSDGGIISDKQFLAQLIRDSGDLVGKLNGTEEGRATVSFNSSPTRFTVGTDTGSFESNSLFQEIILYDSDQSSNRSDIESDINDYFGIF